MNKIFRFAKQKVFLLINLIFLIKAQPLVRMKLADGSMIVGREKTTNLGRMVHEYLGIPFAEAPEGELRFKKPIAKRPWTQEYFCTKPPKSCPQSKDTYWGDFKGADMWNANTEISEDCLFLNVWAPQSNGGKDGALLL